MVLEGRNDAEIAQAMNATRESVRDMRKRMRLPPAYIRPTWTKDQDRQAIEMQAAGVPYCEIAKAVGKTLNAVRHRIHRLGYGGESHRLRLGFERRVRAMALIQEGITGKALAEALGCSQQRAWSLKKEMEPMMMSRRNPEYGV